MRNDDIDGFTKYCSISFASALELLQSHAKPTLYDSDHITLRYEINKRVLQLVNII